MSGERSHDPNSSAENLLTTPGDTANGMSAYMNHAGPNSVPSSPPPSYQHVLEETRLAALSENNRTPNKSHRHHLLPRQASADSVSVNSSSCHSSPNNLTATATRARLSRRSHTLSSNDSVSVTVDRDTECEKHIAKGECWQDFEDFEQQKTTTVAAEPNEWPDFSQEPNRGKENFDSQNGGDTWQDYQEPSTSYDASSRQFDESSITTLAMSQCGDPDVVDHRHEEMEAELDEAGYETIGESETEEERRQEEYECKLRQQQPMPEGYIEVANKTSKEMYLAMAKEMGIVCRMSDQCRCLDCQGGYLECGEGEGGDENIKTDGGLGAGTPMFVSEAFGHGMAPACTIL